MRTVADSLGDLLEIKISIIPKEKSREGDQEFRQRWMHVHEELAFDILRGKLAKVNLIEATKTVLQKPMTRGWGDRNSHYTVWL